MHDGHKSSASALGHGSFTGAAAADTRADAAASAFHLRPGRRSGALDDLWKPHAPVSSHSTACHPTVNHAAAAQKYQAAAWHAAQHSPQAHLQHLEATAVVAAASPILFALHGT